MSVHPAPSASRTGARGAATTGRPAGGTGEPAIAARGLTKTYATHHAVDGIDLTVHDGEIFGFLGPNGAGKSTTIALLCALITPTSGHARVAGADVARHPAKVRRATGLLLQHTTVDPDLTLEQNLRLHARLHQLPRHLVRARTREALAMAGLEDRRRDKAATLSGGMRRRLEIARSLLHRPQVLFLDEPTTGLDPHARSHLWRYLLDLRQGSGTTLFVTTHYLKEAEHCDRIAILHAGRIAATGTPVQLKARLGGDRIHLRTDNDSAAAFLLNTVYPPAPHADTPDGISVCAPAGAREITRIDALLSEAGITMNTASVQQPSLDDVFFHHTGHALTPGQEQP
ncbi:ABC transporter ATP-binding protein [Streptomyces olivaceus]|uniref:ABC transporter ATP-binding protein n=1 Tax=Streptomyces olivaceus TaxID=47716 RepID=UPI00363ABAEC